MATLQEIRDAANAKLSGLWTDHILPVQLTYFGGHGHYWQGLVTSGIPEDGAEILADYTSRPHDQGETWEDIFGSALGASLPCALAVDVYDGPGGHGFVGRVWVRHLGVVYTKARNFGPESWRTFDWIVQEPHS